jgi:ferrous iron transport protein B
MKTSQSGLPVQTVPLHLPLLRGARRLRIALVGLPGAGKRTLFDAVASTAPHSAELADTHRVYRECLVQIGLDEASVLDWPSLEAPPGLSAAALASLAAAPGAPDLLIQVIDASRLQQHLELTLALRQLGLPMVLALNRMDEARQQGIFINVKTLAAQLGLPVVPTVALRGQGLTQLFSAAVETARQVPTPLPPVPLAEGPARAAALYQAALRPGPTQATRGWRFWLDEFLLHPQWGLLGCLAVFAAVLFVVFEVSGWIDVQTTQRLIEAASAWQPQSTAGVVGRAVLDGLIGLLGIVVPYMLPLVLLLIALEEMGLMQRIAFVLDRGFHKIGLHGGVAVPFLLGLGCNVPAISAVARSSRGRERVIASLLITFVPCSARSAIILAIAGKSLGVLGVLGIYALVLLLIAVLGRLLSRQPREVGPGQVQDIPDYTLPDWRAMLRDTWDRTSDILTIVTPLLVGGSVLLALLSHAGADGVINALMLPVTVWWLGLPLVLGLPLLFGVLRKELSLLMIFQALGTQDVTSVLSTVQIVTLLVFLTFYVPCVSTFAVMLKTLGRRDAWFSVLLSVGVALLLGGAVRLLLTLAQAVVG